MINSLKDLQSLLKICRKQGITEIELGDVKVKFGDLPSDSNQTNSGDTDFINPLDGFPEGELSPEQLAFYSSGGLPADDPYRTDRQ